VAELVSREVEQHPEDPPKVNVEGIEELVTDKGYHSGQVLERVKGYQVRTYIPEKKQAGKRHWQGKSEEQQAVYQNRRPVRGGYGKSLLRRRGELVERSFAHCYETGGMRRTHLRGHENILKRQLVHVGAFNLSLILRQVLGAGTPRQWKDLAIIHSGRYRCSARLHDQSAFHCKCFAGCHPDNAPLGIRRIISLATRWPSDCKNYQCHRDYCCATLAPACAVSVILRIRC
jgi:hypothetical protein